MDSVARTNQVFPTRAPYRRKSLFTCTVFTSIQPNESYIDVFNARKQFPVTTRPSFARLPTMLWSSMCPVSAGGCQLTIGLVVPIAGLVPKPPFPAVVGSLLFLTTTWVFLFNSTFTEVARYTMTVLNLALGAVSSDRDQPMSAEWVALLSFCLLPMVLCAMFACGEFLILMYHVEQKAHPRPLSQLVTPSVPPAPSDDERTSGITIDQERYSSSRVSRRRKDGLFAAKFDARCILINGSQSSRLNKKVRKRSGRSWLLFLALMNSTRSGRWLSLPTLTGLPRKCARCAGRLTFWIGIHGGAALTTVSEADRTYACLGRIPIDVNYTSKRR